MPRLFIIVLLSCAYIGCSLPAPPLAEHPRAEASSGVEAPREGGTLRVLVGSGLGREDLARDAVALPLAGLASAVTPPPPAESGDAAAHPCWRFDLDAARAVDGDRVLPEEILAEWERGLRDSAAPHRWLLEPIVGVESFATGLASRVEGLEATEGALVLCTSAPAPDLPSRLAHPALWYPQPARRAGPQRGPGPFRLDGSGALEPARDSAGGPPYLQRVEPVEDRNAPALLLRLAEADLGVVVGADAGALLEQPDGPLRMERVERWDRVYALWLDPGRRWVNDPRFRRWLGSLVDRRAMLEFLFDGRGEPASGLLGPDGPGPDGLPAPSDRPLSAASRPRIDLAFEADDPLAASIAARLRAELELHGIDLALAGYDPAEPAAALAMGRSSMVLLAHRPRLDDPVLALMESLAPLPGVPARALRALREASRHADPRERLNGARAVERGLLEEARLVPLVRLHAWLAADRALRGVRTGSDGQIFLERAWWAR